MPTYEYECTRCGTITEVFQGITEPVRRKLRKADDPQCDCNAQVTRLIGRGAGVIFKGSGFYETDYRSESYKKGAEADKKATTDKSDGNGKAPKAKDGKKVESSKKKESVSAD
ncbi:MAG: hypothetical protein JSU63_21300 [Phycisphaerales bacterium]|nr:MAG: hypothetical protein JSU63_21300 [Phycisphaerales bacterium]